MTIVNWVFGRFDMGHPYASGINELLAAPDEYDRGVARNVMHDHRVSPERERVLDGFVKMPRHAPAIRRGLKNYFEKRVRTNRSPDFLELSTNRANMIAHRDPSVAADTVDKDMKLVRVLDLVGLLPVLQWAHDESLPIFDRLFDELTSADRLARWLSIQFSRVAPPYATVLDYLVEAILGAMNGFRRSPNGVFQPTWATAWDAVRWRWGTEPDRWVESMGIPKGSLGRWLAVLVYKARDVNVLVRPTILDAGWRPHHFPSPPSAPLSDGGHPMDLRVSPRATALLPEYIHAQIDHSLEHWINSGRMFGMTVHPTPSEYRQQRESHLDLLEWKYGASVRAWMPRSI